MYRKICIIITKLIQRYKYCSIIIKIWYNEIVCTKPLGHEQVFKKKIPYYRWIAVSLVDFHIIIRITSKIRINTNFSVYLATLITISVGINENNWNYTHWRDQLKLGSGVDRTNRDQKRLDATQHVIFRFL